MTKGGKLFIPKCEYFTTGGYMYLFNCPYKTEQEVKTGTRIPWNLLYPLETEKDKEIARLTAENNNLSVELEVAQRDVETLTRTLEEANDEIKAIEAENAKLRATLFKMETVEKELRARLEKAVELPCVKMVKPKVRINRIGIVNVIREWAVVYIDRQGDFVVEHCRSKTASEARLTELRGGKE